MTWTYLPTDISMDLAKTRLLKIMLDWFDEVISDGVRAPQPPPPGPKPPPPPAPPMPGPMPTDIVAPRLTIDGTRIRTIDEHPIQLKGVNRHDGLFFARSR